MEGIKQKNISCDREFIDEKTKDEEVINIIKDIINKGVDKIEDFIERLNIIYENDYRHKYSEILKFLMEIEDESLDYLVLNMDILKEKISPTECNCTKSFLKLYDHVMLEITRIRIYHDYKEKEGLIENKVNTAKEQLERYESSYNDLQNKFDNINKQVENLNVQSISILGIFSGVIATFFGGLKITTNVFSNLNSNIGKCRIIFMTSLVGIILFNTINLLLSFIMKICMRNTDIYGSYEKPKANHSLVFCFNGLMVGIMIISAIIWFLEKKHIFKL